MWVNVLLSMHDTPDPFLNEVIAARSSQLKIRSLIFCNMVMSRTNPIGHIAMMCTSAWNAARSLGMM